MSGKTRERKVVRTVLSEQIKEQIIEDIYYHKYGPGDKLGENTLAKEMNVSQSTVREALRSLIAMGFLEGKPFKGITVRSLSKTDLWEVYLVRAALESLAAELAAPRITDEELEELDRLVEEMVAAGSRGDVKQRARINIDFHEAMIRASGNRLLAHLYSSMQFASWSMMSANVSGMDGVEIASRHRLLVDALRSRDPKKAREAVREHIENTGKPVVEHFDDAGSGEDS